MNEKQKKVLEALGEVVAKLSDAKLAELAAYGEGMAFRASIERAGSGRTEEAS